MRRALPALCVLLGLCAGCGRDDQPQLPTTAKTMPKVASHYQGRSLEDWMELLAAAPAEEREAQVWAMGHLGTKPGPLLATLAQRLRDPEPSVRLAAIVVTGRAPLPSKEIAGLLAGHLADPKEPLRRHAREALGRWGSQGVEALHESLFHESVRVRWGALRALARVGLAGSATAVRVAALAQKDESASVRRQARFTLARQGPGGIAACALYLRSESVAEREEAAAALTFGGPEAVAPMAKMLADKNEVVAALAAGVLMDLGRAAEPAMPALIKALERAGPVRFNAADALIAIGAPAIPALEKLAKGEDVGLRGIAEYALAEIAKRQ